MWTFRDQIHLQNVSAVRGRDVVIHTDNHDIEVEAFADTFAMPLIRQIGKANIAGQLPADDISHIVRCGSGSLRVFRGDCLRNSVVHWVVLLDIGRCRLAIGLRRRRSPVLRGAIRYGSWFSNDVSHVRRVGVIVWWEGG